MTITLFLGIAIFVILVKQHQKIAYQRRHYGFLQLINHRELLRLQGQFRDFPEDGSQFADALHPYSGDLDIFGKNSLFQYLNRTTTPIGASLLASWLKEKSLPAQTRQRQEAVRELAGKTTWLQDFEATGMHHPNQAKELDNLWKWLKETPVFPHQQLFKFAIYAMPLLSVAVLALWLCTDLPGLIMALPLGINAWLLRLSFQQVTTAIEHTAKNLPTIQAAATLIKRIEEEEFASELLRQQKAELFHGGKSAAAEIRQVAKILDNLEMRNNAIFAMLANGLLLWDLHWTLRLEGWKSKNRENLARWFETVGTFEALGSMAALHFAQPDFVMPEVVEEGFFYEATQLGHPLIHPSKRVSNDFELKGEGHTMVITGSNMSGKSTFLRTVGINAVLAMAGAPVCATQFRFSPVQVFTSMRTQDSLSESVSSFYAELKRIRQLLGIVEQGTPVFYLLDEILKGTNSQDRHNGAKALIRQLCKTRATGLVSTHDLELGSLEAEMPGKVVNYNFSSQLINDQLVFDYALQKGICRSFNASTLMAQMGIKMN